MAQMDLEVVRYFTHMLNYHFPTNPDPEIGNCTTHARSLAEALIKYQAALGTSDELGPEEFMHRYINDAVNNYLPHEIVMPERVGPASASSFSDFLIHPMSRAIPESGMTKINMNEGDPKSSFDKFRNSDSTVAVVTTTGHALVAVKTGQGTVFADSQMNSIEPATPEERYVLMVHDASNISQEVKSRIGNFYQQFDRICAEILKASEDKTIFDPEDDWGNRDFHTNRAKVIKVVIDELAKNRTLGNPPLIYAAPSQDGQLPKINLESGVKIPPGEFVILDTKSITGYEFLLNTGGCVLEINAFDTYETALPIGNELLIGVSSGVRVNIEALTYPPQLGITLD